jgi:hypothetical protein
LDDRAVGGTNRGREHASSDARGTIHAAQND